MLKSPAILSGTTVKRSVVEWEDSKAYWKSGKINLISHDDQQGYYF